MGIRETMNKRPMIATGMVLALVLAAVGFAAYQMFDLRPASSNDPGEPERAFFTVDDGKTWFVDDAAQLAPFQHDGKEAVRAYIVECNGKRSVNHLERYTPEGKQAMLKLREAVKHGPPPGQLVAAAQQRGREVKRPGERNWTQTSDTTAAAAIIIPRAPPGESGDATFVFP
ncbi:MAG TPA: hypothetical protein VH518_20275 [Tepidisphaeraceae bacterium]|jgi:hypothetical protein